MISDFSSLKKAVEGLGVSITVHQREWEKKLWSGLEIDFDEIDKMEPNEAFFDVSPNGQVKPTVVFITQTNLFGNKDPDKTSDLHKYHFFNCKVVSNHRRKSRYKKSTRLDGKFNYRIFKDKDEYIPENYKNGVPLYLCGYCHKIIENLFGSYSKKELFELEAFLTQFCSQGGVPNSTLDFSGMELRPDIGDRPRVYSAGWERISKRFRESANYTCQECGIYLGDSSTRKWCHVHHANGDPSDNVVANLRCLCIGCHAKECMHHHVTNLPAHSEFLASNVYNQFVSRQSSRLAYAPPKT
ncbi:MAG: HNH endonuclease [Roseibacillus sp.]